MPAHSWALWQAKPARASAPNAEVGGLVGVILAGGQSSRMGQEKARVQLAGRTLIEWVSAALKTVCSQLLVVGGSAELADLAVAVPVADAVGGAGPLDGLVAALRAAQHDILVVACDMPFLQPVLLQGLISSAAPQADAVVPLKDGLYEPLVAVYRFSCLRHFEEALSRGVYKVVEAYRGLCVQPVPEACWRSWDPGGLSFFNINRPSDLVRAEELVAKGEVWPTRL